MSDQLTRKSLGLVLMTLDNLLTRAVDPEHAAEVAAEQKAIILVASRAQLLLAMVEARPDPKFRR